MALYDLKIPYAINNKANSGFVVLLSKAIVTGKNNNAVPKRIYPMAMENRNTKPGVKNLFICINS